MSDPIYPRDLADTAAVRKMCGRALRTDRKPITRHTLLRWREHEGFPAPLDTPQVAGDLWDRRLVRQWIKDRGDFQIHGRGRPPSW